MKKKTFSSKVNVAIVFSLFFIMVLGCQPEGGELLPIQSGNIQISSSRFENDTAVIEDENFKITLYGTWDGRAEVRAIIENIGEDNVRVDFNSSKILDSGGEDIKIDSVDEDNGVSMNQIKDGVYSVGAKEKRKLVIGFPLYFSSTDKNSRIISIVLAVTTNSKTKEMRFFKIDFKGIGKEDNSGKSDPVI
jgi:hypothetical protein